MSHCISNFLKIMAKPFLSPLNKKQNLPAESLEFIPSEHPS